MTQQFFIITNVIFVGLKDPWHKGWYWQSSFPNSQGFYPKNHIRLKGYNLNIELMTFDMEFMLNGDASQHQVKNGNIKWQNFSPVGFDVIFIDKTQPLGKSCGTLKVHAP